MGWRYTLFTLGAICLFIFFLRFIVFRFQESPKYLLYRGKDEKAVKVLHHIAKFNGRESAINLEMFSALTDEDSSVGTRDTGTPILGAGSKQIKSSLWEKAKLEVVRYKILFSTSQMARLTILVWIIYMFDYWGFSIAGLWILFMQGGLISLLFCRQLSAKDPVGEKHGHKTHNGTDVSRFRDYLYLRHSWCTPGCAYVWSSTRWTKVGHGCLLGLDGCFIFRVYYRQQRGVKHWLEPHGVFFPKVSFLSMLPLFPGVGSFPRWKEAIGS